MEHYRFHREGAVFYVTFSVVEWLPVFVSEAACKIIVDSLNFCHRKKSLRTNAYVIMPTHMHAIVFDEEFDSTRLAATITDFRKHTGRQVADYCAAHMPSCFTERFVARAGDDRQRRFWQSSRHPVQIETQEFWQVKLDYLHANPSRKGLVVRADDWRFSSAAYWLSDGESACDVTLSGIAW
jgi:hypothetical protein